MLSHIPQEILTEILKRLPVKSLVQLSCVCKSWCSLITSPGFISLHTKYTLETTDNSLLRHYNWAHKKETYMVYNHDGDEEHEGQSIKSSLGESQELIFPFKSCSQFFEIVGSCNGLLCLSDTYRINSHTVILWNPAIRKSVTLPKPHISLDHIYMFVLGFGFDAKINDFKVVRIVYGVGADGFRVVTSPEVEVYQLGINTWRTINVNTAPQYIISELSLQVFLNRSVHWIGYNPDGHFRDLSVVLFDMRNESFREMKVPDSIAGLSVLDLSIGVHGQLLSLMQYNRHMHSQWVQYGGCCIWVMKEYGVVESWTKMFTIDLLGGVGKALGPWREGQVLLVTSGGELISYELEDGRCNHLGIEGIVNSFYLNEYVETLALLKDRQWGD